MTTHSLNTIHTQIVETLRIAMGNKLETVSAYVPDQERLIDTPALMVELETIEDGDDRGDERIPMVCRFAAHCILSRLTPNVDLAIRDFAAQVLAIVRHNRWGIDTDVCHPKQLEALPGQFKPGADGYESWVVTWDQTFYLGLSVWDGQGVIPAKVLFGWAPRIGAAHESDYRQQP